jgi:hypothetical protein
MARPRHYHYHRDDLDGFPFEVHGYRARKAHAARKHPSLRHRWLRKLHAARASLVRAHGRRRRGHKTHHRRTR